MLGLRRFADDEKAGSLSDRFRSKRFEFFKGLIAGLPRPVRILDIGGTPLFWVQRGCGNSPDFDITTVNLTAGPQEYKNIKPVTGDATRLANYCDKSFDIVFSNSVIEHLFTFEKQKAMASEVERIGRAYWVQTPNFWFPIEPHFHVPGWQWMPLRLRTAILQRCTCGWRGRTPDPVRARQIVSEVRLMTRRELRQLFPASQIIPEKFGGLTKSWIVVGGLMKSPVASE